MAHKRQRGNSWEFVVKRAGVLDKPLTLTFKDEAEGDEYCRRLEALLDRGIVPPEYQPETRVLSVSDLINRYCHEYPVKSKDAEVLATVAAAKGATAVAAVDAQWVDNWIAEMKQVHRYAPATIRAKVGALARCCDWGMRKKLIIMPDHPLRTLPDGYATYSEKDAALAGGERVDIERDRRLEGDEESRIRAVIEKGVLSRKQRPFIIQHKEAVMALFDLALESAMRLREMYTLTTDQVNIPGRTINLERTKNGDKRQVPMTSVAVRVMSGLSHGENVFPWWNGSLDKKALKLTSNYISKLFDWIFEEAGCPDLNFHDLRHEATSRIYERTTLETEEIMKITGHRTHKMMMRYLKLRTSNLAAKMW